MLGDRIRTLRLERNLIQSDIADKANISRSWLSRVEANEISTPDPKKLRAVAKVLNVDPEELLSAAGYLQRDEREPSIEEMSTDELMSRIARFLAEVNRRARRRPHTDEVEPSVRRHAHARVAVLA